MFAAQEKRSPTWSTTAAPIMCRSHANCHWHRSNRNLLALPLVEPSGLRTLAWLHTGGSHLYIKMITAFLKQVWKTSRALPEVHTYEHVLLPLLPPLFERSRELAHCERRGPCLACGFKYRENKIKKLIIPRSAKCSTSLFSRALLRYPRAQT